MKTKNGRKARASVPAIMVGVRVTAEERTRFLDAADKRGCSTLSDFIREALEFYAGLPTDKIA